jgi:uncharacterized protein (TIGR00290 family)
VKPAVFCWSGGKDSSLCLYKVLQDKVYDVKVLITTVNEQFRRISMHGVKEELLDAQASALGIPLIKIYVKEGTNAEYERKMEETLLGLKSKGIEHVIFGDIFLEDLRKYREDNLTKVGMEAVFPLWKQDTGKLLEEFLALKFKTVLCCTNDAYLGEEWAGRMIDNKFISKLPGNVDPCGENGEYHTFCFDGPIFKTPVPVTVGEKVYKPLVVKTTDDCALPESKTKGFWFCELS